MKLTTEQIIAAANGIIRTEQNELGLELHRFSRTQEGFFYQTHPLYCRESFFNGYFGRNCRTCAGVTLDFVCDAEEININFGRIEATNDSTEQKIDLYVDGEFARTFEVEGDLYCDDSGQKKLHYEAQGALHHYVLYLPYFAFPIISGMELAGASVYEPRKREAEILFLGDSITQGVGATHPGNTYVCRVARNLGVGILNQANSGFVYDAGSLERVCNPKVVVTAYGINDYGRKSLEQLENQTREYLKKVRELYPEAVLVSILPLWTVWNGENENYRVTERTCLKGIYEELSDVVVDGHEMMPHHSKYLSDQVHPNDEGYACYGENLSVILRSVLENL